MLVKELLNLVNTFGDKNNAGIYMIYCLIDDKAYIGQSKKIKRRWAYHKYYLNRTQHVNSYIQRAWSKYGKEAFNFLVLENCIPEHLSVREEYWLSLLSKEASFNLKTAGPQIEFSDETKYKLSLVWKGKKHTEETKKRMSQTRTGKKHSPETIEKIRTKAKNMSTLTKSKMSSSAKLRKR